MNRIEFLNHAKDHFKQLGDKQIPTITQVGGMRQEDFEMTNIVSDSVFDVMRTVAVKTNPLLNFRAERFFVLKGVELDQEDCHKIGCSSHGSFMTGVQVAERIENRVRELTF
jgi:hypothetical protein